MPPAKPTQRALAYVRVSTAREDMISPDLQLRAIRDYCRQRGYELIGVHEDLDQSGRNFARIEVQRVVQRVEAREAEVVVVWKLSRFGRTRRDWYVHSDRLEVAGGRLESATEGFDPATSSGRLTRGMLVELAAFESDRIGEVWKEVQSRRVDQGLTHNGRARFGYRYDGDVHQPDPVTGPILADCYRRFTGGESAYKIVQSLNARGIRTTSGGLWTDGTMRRVLESGFAAGLLLWDGEHVSGAHSPVITDDEWRAYQRAKRTRAKTAQRTKDSPYLLSGLVRCGVCGGKMNGGRFGTNRSPKYRCETRRATAGAGCTVGYVSMVPVDAAAFEWLRTIATELDEAAVIAEQAASREHDEAAKVAQLAGEVARLEGMLVKLTQLHLEDPSMDRAVYDATRIDYTTRLAEARRQHDVASAAVDRLQSSQAAAEVPPSVVDDWHTLPVTERREMLRCLIDRVEVTTHPGRATPPTVRVVPVWEAATPARSA